MIQEDKQISLIDLCARVPYHPKGHVVNACNGAECDEWLTCATFPMFVNITNNCRLYLRSMSNMTEKELVDYKLLEKQCEILPTFAYINVSKCVIFDWLNKHHFDYRGLIEKGLAIEAPEEMYKLKEQQ